jgi:hypothetical protein
MYGRTPDRRRPQCHFGVNSTKDVVRTRNRSLDGRNVSELAGFSRERFEDEAHRASPPAMCPECGVAGAVYMPADPDDLSGGDSDGDGLRTTWLRGGIEQSELVARA